jgi:hypothetical protein
MEQRWKTETYIYDHNNIKKTFIQEQNDNVVWFLINWTWNDKIRLKKKQKKLVWANMSQHDTYVIWILKIELIRINLTNSHLRSIDRDNWI